MPKFANTDIDIDDIGIEYNTARVIKARNSFIRECVGNGAKYIGRVDKNVIPEKGLNKLLKHITGKEIWIEYFLFDVGGMPAFKQWRLVDT